MDAPAVVARGLTKRYGTLEAVRGIDFTIAQRTCFGFLGVNGAGKTTTMKMMYCRIARTAGELAVLGMDAADHAKDIKRRIGVVVQETALDPELSVIENLMLYAAFFGITGDVARRRSRELLDFVALEGKSRSLIRDLSGGMKRRLMIARALVNDPELLILDEPTTGLDPQARLMVWEKLQQLREEGKTLVLTSHYMEEAARLCERLVIMDEGRIHAQGTPTELIARFAAPDVLEVFGTDAAALEHLAVDGLVQRRERHGDVLYIYNADNRALLHRLGELGVEPERHMARPSTLEDVFLNITGRELTE